MKVFRGKKHDYPGITLDYSTRGAFKVDTKYHINAMKEAFPCKTNKTLKAWDDKLFSVDTNSSRLDEEKSDMFLALTMKCIFTRKRGQPDVESRVEFLSTCTSILAQ